MWFVSGSKIYELCSRIYARVGCINRKVHEMSEELDALRQVVEENNAKGDAVIALLNVTIERLKEMVNMSNEVESLKAEIVNVVASLQEQVAEFDTALTPPEEPQPE